MNKLSISTKKRKDSETPLYTCIVVLEGFCADTITRNTKDTYIFRCWEVSQSICEEGGTIVEG